MVGVTIGVGSTWRERAQIAAAAAEQATGLDVVILGDDEFARSRLPLPIMLKTVVFDLLGVEDILLFDADLLFVRKWDPQQFADREELVCARDFWFEPHISREAARFGIPPGEYFNAGLLIMNRRHHAPLLEHARRSLFERPSVLVEQSAMNASRIRLGIAAHFLDRRYNTLSGPGCNLWSYVPPIAIHDAGALVKDMSVDGVTGGPAGRWSVDEAATRRLAGKFFLFTVGKHPPRALELRPDATVGAGSMLLERYWYACTDGERTKLLLASRYSISAELEQTEDGAWEGRQIGVPLPEPLRLHRHPGEAVADALRSQPQGQRVGAEVGAGAGESAAVLLRRCQQVSLYIVDQWEDSGETDSTAANATQTAARPQADAPRSAMKESAAATTRFAESRRYIIDRPPAEATDCLPDASLGFVYLHNSSAAAPPDDLLRAWLRKMQPGGLLLAEGPHEDVQKVLSECGFPQGAVRQLDGTSICSARKPFSSADASPEPPPGRGHLAARTAASPLPSFITDDTARPTADAFLARLPPYPPGRFRGRGVVVCGGGQRYLTCAWVCINMLRRCGCELPIELWQTTRFELDGATRELFRPLGVTCVESDSLRRQHPVRRLAGWELKPYAMIHSSFEEVLLLDADNVPVADPTPLFDAPQYQQAGVIFWPDYGRLEPDRLIWNICRVQYRDEPEVESGQILLDKRRSWRPLNLAMHLNEYSDFYYQHVHGDKETFHMAWRMLDHDYAMVPHPICGLPGTMCQHDFAGKRMFQHRNMAKWNFDGSNERIPGFKREEECLALLEELRAKWDGRVGCDWDFNEAEQRAAQSVIDQRRFQYVRIGYDSRPIEFLPAGKIGEGRASCEEAWYVEEEPGGGAALVIVGKGEQTCRLRPGAGGTWRGYWLSHERMPIKLLPLDPAPIETSAPEAALSLA